MAFRVCYSDESATKAAGFGKVAHLPFILDNRPGYHRIASRYLIDRGLGEWRPGEDGERYRSVPPSKKTIHSYACWLANFLEWAEVRDIELEDCQYAEHIHGRYQREMLEGVWSASGSGLKPTTANPRVQQACDFLCWMAQKNLRRPFFVPSESVKVRLGTAKSAHGFRAKEVSRRVGAVRENKRRLRIPRSAEVSEWLSSVRHSAGEALSLACETILLTGVRLTEAASLRADFLPKRRKDWVVANPDAPLVRQEVLITLRHGTKGPDFGEVAGVKIGPERTILMPLHLAERLHAYREEARTAALTELVTRTKRDAAGKKRRMESALALFLHEDGDRVTGDNIYRAWKQGALPYKEWCPHLGRDWWACTTLIEEIERHSELRLSSPALVSQLLESTAVSVIRLRIQPQLGHKSEETCLIYLQWVMDRFGGGLSIRYDAALELASHDEQQ